MPQRLYYITKNDRRIDGADRLCDINTLLAYHQKKNRDATAVFGVVLYDGYVVR